MPVTRSSSDLINNFNEIFQYCQSCKEPIILTNNGQGNLAIMSVETLEEISGKQKLYNLLAEAQKARVEGRVYTEEEADKLIEAM